MPDDSNETTDLNREAELARRLTLPEFPRSAACDPRWMLKNLMGPNVIWLAESLTQVMRLEPGMRVLDMGCGRAISSIFLAKEFDVQVWATDLWVTPDENWERIKQAGLAASVFPIHAEAHDLPYAAGFFDALVSLDAYHYFGTNDLYLQYYARLVRAGGPIGIVVPGIRQEFAGGLPGHLAPYWERDFWSFHSPQWWRTLWERTGPVKVEHADMAPDGWHQWITWLEVCRDFHYPFPPSELEMLRLDAGRNLGFSRIVARKI
ncbi:MAG TPA: methyltransferase domain-containing protein [Chloroflexota bacterium]|nr:methyltransferase domain-containing protein [Chloroflexota bacterium]